METTQPPSILPRLGRRNELALFKGLVRSLAQDGLAALEGLNGAGPLSPEQQRQLGLVHHYLSYLCRLCEGRV